VDSFLFENAPQHFLKRINFPLGRVNGEIQKGALKERGQEDM